MIPLGKDETRRDSSLALTTSHYTVIKNVYVFLCMVLLAVRMVADVTETRNVMMVADVTETRNVIPGLEFKTCMTIKS